MKPSHILALCFGAIAICILCDAARKPKALKVEQATSSMLAPSEAGSALFAVASTLSERSVHPQDAEFSHPVTHISPPSDPNQSQTQALITRYQQSRKQDLDARWAIIESLGNLQSKQSAQFLASIAVRPLPATPVEPSRVVEHHEHTQGCNMGAPSDQMQEMAPREWSAAAMVRMYVDWSPTPAFLTTILDDILKHADPQVSQFAAMTLFSHDALTKQHRAILDARGVFHNFRFLSEDEQEQLFRSDKVALAPKAQ